MDISILGAFREGFRIANRSWPAIGLFAGILVLVTVLSIGVIAVTSTSAPSGRSAIRAMAGQDFSAMDRADPVTFNRALWRGLKGAEPYPTIRTGEDLLPRIREFFAKPFFDYGPRAVRIAKRMDRFLAGGALPYATTVSEQYLLDLEREAFLSLCGERKTLDRIQHTLKTGKPLRN